ncbi:MAG: hypothetical protein ABL958_10210 [Bdellovibrionia bacterium]
MRTFLSVLVACVLFAASAGPASEGGLVGNGGDVVECKPTTTNPLNGLYSLDYLLTYQGSNQNADVVQVPNLRASVMRLRALFATKVPELLPTFDSFTQYYRNTTNKNAPRFWEEAPFGLVDLKDEKMLALVPENCREGNVLKISQAIIRQPSSSSGAAPGTIIYKFVPKVVEGLEQRWPLQLSFLYVHEWLWDVSQNVDRNRRLNRYFHSKEFENHSPQDARAIITRLGLTLPEPISTVFDPQSCMPQGYRVIELFKKFLTDKDSAKIGEFAVFGRNRDCNTNGKGPCEMVMGDITPLIREYLGFQKGTLVLAEEPPRLELWDNTCRRETPLANCSPPVKISTCGIDIVTGATNCSDFIHPKNGKPFWPYEGSFLNKARSFNLSGFLRPECLWLSAGGMTRYTNAKGDTIEEEIQLVVHTRF